MTMFGGGLKFCVCGFEGLWKLGEVKGGGGEAYNLAIKLRT